MPRAKKTTETPPPPPDLDEPGNAYDRAEADGQTAEADAQTAETNADDDLGFAGIDDTTEYINALYYGREGTGKSTNLATMANLGRVLVVNAEGGLKRRALAARGIKTENLVIWPPAGKRVSYKGLEAVHDRLLSDLMADESSWFGVAIDSATEATTELREQATRARQDKLERKGTSYDPNLVDRDDYGVMTDQLRRVVRWFRDLPCHFVMTALERVNDNPEAGPVGVGPDLTPALASSALGYVDFVLCTRATIAAAGETDSDSGVAEFRALTRPSTKYRAKDRFGVTPAVLASPTFERLLSYIQGDLHGESDPLQQEYERRRAEIEEAKAAEKKAREQRKRETATK